MPVTTPLAFPGYTGAIVIGSELDQAGTVNWNGMLDDVAVFDGALTQSQIDTVMTGDFSSFIGGPVNFVSQPQSQTEFQGSNATFGVGVAGQAPFQYQWYFGTNKLSSVSQSDGDERDISIVKRSIESVGDLFSRGEQWLGRRNESASYAFRIPASIIGRALAI